MRPVCKKLVEITQNFRYDYTQLCSPRNPFLCGGTQKFSALKRRVFRRPPSHCTLTCSYIEVGLKRWCCWWAVIWENFQHHFDFWRCWWLGTIIHVERTRVNPDFYILVVPSNISFKQFVSFWNNLLAVLRKERVYGKQHPNTLPPVLVFSF